MLKYNTYKANLLLRHLDHMAEQLDTSKKISIEFNNCYAENIKVVDWEDFAYELYCLLMTSPNKSIRSCQIRTKFKQVGSVRTTKSVTIEAGVV
jgi:hypothetical protein